jgi:hypothetical protein
MQILGEILVVDVQIGVRLQHHKPRTRTTRQIMDMANITRETYMGGRDLTDESHNKHRPNFQHVTDFIKKSVIQRERGDHLHMMRHEVATSSPIS